MSIPSPCINVCRMNAEGYCEGCLRTLSEITEWSRADDPRKQAILAEVAVRRAAVGTRAEGQRACLQG